MYSSAKEWESHKCQIVYQSLILILSQTFWLCVFEFHYEEFNLVLIFCGRSPPHLKMFYKKRCWNSHGTNGQWLVFETTKKLSEYIGRLNCLLFQKELTQPNKVIQSTHYKLYSQQNKLIQSTHYKLCSLSTFVHKNPHYRRHLAVHMNLCLCNCELLFPALFSCLIYILRNVCAPLKRQTTWIFFRTFLRFLVVTNSFICLLKSQQYSFPRASMK